MALRTGRARANPQAVRGSRAPWPGPSRPFGPEKRARLLSNCRWLAFESHLNFIEDKSEWKGTKKVLLKSPKKAHKTEFHLTHVGFVPDYECYRACSNARSSYINGGLWSLTTAGKGSPSGKKRIDLPSLKPGNRV